MMKRLPSTGASSKDTSQRQTAVASDAGPCPRPVRVRKREKNRTKKQKGRPPGVLQKAAVLLCRTKGGLQTAAGKWFHFFPKTGAAMWQNRCFRANENRTQNMAPEAAGPCPGPQIASS